MEKRCPDCYASLSIYDVADKGDGRCRYCDGTGEVADFFDNKCRTCYGTGQCQTCGGTGYVYSDDDYNDSSDYSDSDYSDDYSSDYSSSSYSDYSDYSDYSSSSSSDYKPTYETKPKYDPDDPFIYAKMAFTNPWNYIIGIGIFLIIIYFWPNFFDNLFK